MSIPGAGKASRLAAALPDRLVPVGEQWVLLLLPAAGPAARNKIWAELVSRRRAGTRPGPWRWPGSRCPTCAAPASSLRAPGIRGGQKCTISGRQQARRSPTQRLLPCRELPS
jgi:hypothetical protein